jgi:hypothetical protein
VVDIRTPRGTTVFWELVAVLIVAVAFLVSFAGVARADPKTDDGAVAALKHVVAYASEGQYGKAWKSVHPAQKAIIAERVYVTCGAKLNRGVTVSDVEVVSIHHEPTMIPGTKTTAPSVAITAKYTFNRAGSKHMATSTFHEYFVKGKWKFAVSNPEQYTAEC